jgi:hypothetical protein
LRGLLVFSGGILIFLFAAFTEYLPLGVGALALSLAVILGMAYVKAFEWRLSRRLVESDCLLCENCAYPLAGLPSNHNCPECGHAYSKDETRKRWKRWLAD